LRHRPAEVDDLVHPVAEAKCIFLICDRTRSEKSVTLHIRRDLDTGKIQDRRRYVQEDDRRIDL